MSQENNTTTKQKSKQLDAIEIGQIEAYLNEGLNTVEIGKKLDRDPSGIRKEIKNYSIIKKPTSKKCSSCGQYTICKKTKLCGKDVKKGCASKCKKCQIAKDVCKDYTTEVLCKQLRGQRKVCNGCEKYETCKQPKRIYNAKEVFKIHKKNRKNSVKQYKAVDKKEYLEKISTRIKRGQSPEVILNTLEDKDGIKISVPTLYAYTDLGFMSCANIDLKNKVKRRIRKQERAIKTSREKHRGNGRSIHDLEEIARTREELGRAEMDTVEGE